MPALCPMGRRRGWRESTFPRSTACTRDLWQTPRPREENLRSCVSEKMGRTLHACFQTESGESPGRFTEEVRSRKSLGQTQRGEESPGAVFLGPLSLTLTQGSIPVNHRLLLPSTWRMCTHFTGEQMEVCVTVAHDPGCDL